MKNFRTFFSPASLLAAALIFLAPPSYAEEFPPGDVFSDCLRCPELVVVPAGTFQMGENGRHKAERPAHPVTISRSFAIGRYEVTFDDWQACLDDGGCSHKPDDHGWGRERRPVINITLKDIRQYTSWISKKTGQIYRLPSEAEWERAARGQTTTQFWWGDKVGKKLANCRDCDPKKISKGTLPVGSFSANPFGLFDTSGNVWERVEDCWQPNHENAPKNGAARTNPDNACINRVIRGGSWYYFSKNLRSAWRFRGDVRVKSYGFGFRVVRELP
jgi:formylglycine-generating enzyme required for sulfatase activity